MNASIISNELKKLRNGQNNLELSEITLLEYLRKYESDITELYTSKTLKRKAEVIQLQNKMYTILSVLKEIRIKLETPQDLDLKEFRKQMLNIQENISAFKQNCEKDLEILIQDENIMKEQIISYECKIIDWEKTINTDLIILKEKRPLICKKKFAFEVKEYLDFVNQHGNCGGWKLEDHNLFLKVKLKIKEPQKLAKYINSLMPDKSIEDILEHDNWYKKYQQLREKQRSLIKEWKSHKNPPCFKNQSKSMLNIYHLKDFNTDEDKKEQIKNWKANKERKMKEIKEENLKKLELIKQFEINKQNKNKKAKIQVIMWKTERNEKKLKEKLQKEFLQLTEKQEKSKEALKAIKLFQSKDDEFIERNKKKKESNMNKTSSSLIRSKTCAPRDPTRLFKPTTQWIQRTKKEEKKIYFPMDIKQIPKLSMPEWRKDVTLKE